MWMSVSRRTEWFNKNWFHASITLRILSFRFIIIFYLFIIYYLYFPEWIPALIDSFRWVCVIRNELGPGNGWSTWCMSMSANQLSASFCALNIFFSFFFFYIFFCRNKRYYDISYYVYYIISVVYYNWK